MSRPLSLHVATFEGKTDHDLVMYWNEGDGAISWLAELEAELNRRGYQTRATDPDDDRPRVGGSRLVLYSRTPEPAA